MYATLTSTITQVNTQLFSVFLNRTVDIVLYYPSGLSGNESLNLLLLNDGQDLEAMHFDELLAGLHESWKITPLMVVGIKASEERLLEYGVANRPDFKKRGAKAHLYTRFITEELLPFLQEQAVAPLDGKKAIAGFSLGGLSAFDIAWNNPGLFNVTGVFSGSFWWRKKDLKAGYTDKDRILHQLIRETKSAPALKFWLMTGTDDETADRNHNFIIDSIDDTIDVIKELLQKGYKRPDDIFYYEKVGGRHDIPTWANTMPAFLIWAFGR